MAYSIAIMPYLRAEKNGLHQKESKGPLRHRPTFNHAVANLKGSRS